MDRYSGFSWKSHYYINKEGHDFIWEGITNEPKMSDNNLHPAYYINPMERINAHEFHVGAHEDTDGFHGRAIFIITETVKFGIHYFTELNSGGSLNLASTGNSRAPTSTDVDSPLGQLPGPYALNEKIKRPNSINFRYALYEGVNYPFVEMGQFFLEILTMHIQFLINNPLLTNLHQMKDRLATTIFFIAEDCLLMVQGQKQICILREWERTSKCF